MKALWFLFLFTLVATTGPSGAASVPDLIAALGNADAVVRRGAAKALGETKDPLAVKPLVEALEDDDTNVRFYAAYALGEIREPSSAKALLKALTDPVWAVRDQAAWALRELRDPSLIPSLVESLAEETADVPHIMWILKHMDAAAMVAPLEKLLDHSRQEIRMHAVSLLGESNQPGASKALLGCLDDSSVVIRRRVIAILLEKRVAEAVAPLQALAQTEKDRSVRAEALEALELLSRHAHLAAHWSFDDRGATVARDTGGRGVDGEIKGCNVVPGKVGHALEFGKGRFIELGKPVKLPMQGMPFTVMAWVKSKQPNGVVVARGGAFQGYSLYLKEGVARFGIHLTEEGETHLAIGKEQVVGRWVHLAGVVHEKRIELYVDAKLAAATQTPGYLPGNSGQGMEIGFDVSNSPCEIVDPLVGVIDEVRLYEAALPLEDIRKEAGIE